MLEKMTVFLRESYAELKRVTWRNVARCFIPFLLEQILTQPVFDAQKLLP